MKHDLIVAGAGIAGCFLASKVARAGYRVALCDARPKSKIGNLWEVGVNRSVFNRLGIRYPNPKHWEEEPEQTLFYAGDMKASVAVRRDSFNLLLIRHRTLNRVFLDEALKAGVQFYSRCRVTGPLVEDGRCRGVAGHKRFSFVRHPFTFRAPVTADCTGAGAVLRKKLPGSFLIKRDIRIQDYASAWQEVWTVDPAKIAGRVGGDFLRPGTCFTRLGKYQAFSSVHLRRNNTLNMIFGASVSKDNLAYFICKDYVKGLTYLKEKVSAGGGIIPIRRSLDNLADHGFLLVGDSACQVIPTMGSGIEAQLTAADIAARAVVHALNEGNTSREFLWQYNVEYQNRIGAVLASYDIMRRFIQSVSADEMNDILRSGLIKDKNFATTYATSEITYNIAGTIDNIRKIFSNPHLLPVILRFTQALSDSKKALELYLNYPKIFDPDAFADWQDRTNELFARYRTFRNSADGRV